MPPVSHSCLSVPNPFCCHQGKHDPVCIWGKPEYSVIYNEKYYRMSSQECLAQFLRQPWVFLQAKLPDLVPLKKDLLRGLPPSPLRTTTPKCTHNTRGLIHNSMPN